MSVVAKHWDGPYVLIEEHERGPWPFYVYLCGYGNFRPAFKGAAATLEAAKEIGARHDYCRQFRK